MTDEPARPALSPAEAEIARLWPALHLRARIEAGAEALPAPDVPLDPFLAPVPGPAGPTWPSRHRSLPRHFRALEPEFAGQPRLAHLLAACIVVLRRQPGDPAGLALFRRICTERGETLVGAMNLRWLTAVCDTFCDIGTPVERATALAGTLASALVKLAETERRLFYPERPWPPQRRVRQTGPLFDGVITYWVTGGDMVTNLLDRAGTVLAEANPASAFVGELLSRLATHDTVLARSIELNDGRELPLATPAQRRAAREAMKDL